jgi:hypothetical protein
LKFSFLEPEVSTNQTEKDDLVTSQDGWLNALSLQKLTNTVGGGEIEDREGNQLYFIAG